MVWAQTGLPCAFCIERNPCTMDFCVNGGVAVLSGDECWYQTACACCWYQLGAVWRRLLLFA